MKPCSWKPACRGSVTNCRRSHAQALGERLHLKRFDYISRVHHGTTNSLFVIYVNMNKIEILIINELCDSRPMTNSDEFSHESVANRLIWLRKFLELNQKEFAHSIGVLPTQQNNWETAKQRLSLQGAIKINATYGTSLDFLFLGRVDTLPQNMRKAWISRPADK
ncbi:helix-turn-helix transcriptional regulator [Polycladidibacter hongkongensis]|uniref:helix-turn-helix transcriptional regulator n=1 Tax=Polycladidibacter hongkongensis TaxID=1647556 RepID=UPI0012E35786|nr:helix-turn-helix transcriptional regulator [Pseudovibrio hongkongensis]